jgi:uroporphyrinogen decarboxylase
MDPIDGDLAREAFGTIVQQGNVLHVVEPVLPEPTLDGYEWPDPEKLIDWDPLRREYEHHPDSFRVCGLAMGLFERAWLMRGFEPLLMDMLTESDFVEKLLDGIRDYHIRMMDMIVERIPVEGYFGGDDWCDQRTVMMGIDLWRKFFKPRLAELIEHAHSLDKPYILHSCGNLSPLIDDLIEINLDALESLQAEAMNVYKAKRKAAGRLVLIGGMGVQRTIPFGSPDEVHVETCKLLRELGRGGGYVLAPSKPLPAGTPIANAVEFIETALQDNHS